MKKFLKKVSANYQISSRPNREIENVFSAYEVSWETERLGSENNRQIYCELIRLGLKENVENVNENIESKPVIKVVDEPKQNLPDDGEEEEEQQIEAVDIKRQWWTRIKAKSNFPKRLNEIAVETIARDFNNGLDISSFPCLDAKDFGLLIDVDMPILDLIDLENETFWKRVVQSKIRDVLKFQELSRNPETDWKKIGLELKFEEIIEALDQNVLDSMKTKAVLDQLAMRLQSKIENLSIKKIKPRKNFERNISRVVNFSSDECFHGSLEFLGLFNNLKSLSLKFDPGLLHYNYERRFVQVATIDIENIGKALAKLQNLEKFEILCSDLSESIKIQFLLDPLTQVKQLTHLSLTFCAITSSESGEEFFKLMKVNQTLKHLELKGNNLNLGFCHQLARGLKEFEGNFNFLGLSLNPIFDEGLEEILRSINLRNNVNQLDISQCLLDCNLKSEKCIQELISLIQASKTIREIKLNDNKISFDKEKFIEALKVNFEIQDLNCENCGFSTSEMVKIKVLVCRNQYYKQNPILKKDNFTAEDEIEIEKYLSRVKHPLLLKYKMTPRSPLNPPWTAPPRKTKETIENYKDFAYSV